jgi:hypothetical protein
MKQTKRQQKALRSRRPKTVAKKKTKKKAKKKPDDYSWMKIIAGPARELVPDSPPSVTHWLPAPPNAEPETGSAEREARSQSHIQGLSEQTLILKPSDLDPNPWLKIANRIRKIIAWARNW